MSLLRDAPARDHRPSPWPTGGSQKPLANGAHPPPQPPDSASCISPPGEAHSASRCSSLSPGGTAVPTSAWHSPPCLPQRLAHGRPLRGQRAPSTKRQCVQACSPRPAPASPPPPRGQPSHSPAVLEGSLPARLPPPLRLASRRLLLPQKPSLGHHCCRNTSCSCACLPAGLGCPEEPAGRKAAALRPGSLVRGFGRLLRGPLEQAPSPPPGITLPSRTPVPAHRRGGRAVKTK